MNKIADPFRVPKAVFFDLICLGIICFSFIRGTRFYYKNKYLGFLLIWIFVTCFFNWFFPMSITRNNRQIWNLFTLEPMLHLILAVFASFIALSTLDKDDFMKLAKAFCISGVLITVFGIMQIIGFDPFGKISYYNHPNKFGACLDNPNLVGNYLCLIYPFFFALKEVKYKLMSFIVFAGILLSKSTISVGVAFAGFILVFLFMQRKNKYLIGGIFLIFVLAAFLIFNNQELLKLSSGFDGRIEVWKQTLLHIKDNPIFGQGLGVYKTFDIKIGDVISQQAHNDWLQRWLEIGAVGIFLLILVVLNSLKNFNYRQSDNIARAYLISFVSFFLLMFGSFPMEIAPIALIGLVDFWAVEKL